nr:unnamed protein product [Spirometra erinaceieuropaei]
MTFYSRSPFDSNCSPSCQIQHEADQRDMPFEISGRLSALYARTTGSRPRSSKCQHLIKPVPVRPPSSSSSSSNHQPESFNFANLSKFSESSVLHAARRLEKFTLRISSTQAQLRFLHCCLVNQLTPKSVTYKPPVNSALHGRL